MKDNTGETEVKQEKEHRFRLLKGRKTEKQYDTANVGQFLKYLGFYVFGMVFM